MIFKQKTDKVSNFFHVFAIKQIEGYHFYNSITTYSHPHYLLMKNKTGYVKSIISSIL